jgi:hypothetical protein
MEYIAGGKGCMWKAVWSTMQVEKAKVLYQVERLKYYTGGRLENNAGGKAEVLFRWKAGEQCRWKMMKYYTGGRLD